MYRRLRNRTMAADSDPLVDEITGYTALGMKREALNALHLAFRQQPQAATLLPAAVDCLLAFQCRLGRWEKLLERIWERLPVRKQARARSAVLQFYAERRNAEMVLNLAPRRFVGPVALLEMGWVCSATLHLDRVDILAGL